MAKIFGVLLIVLGVWVGMEIYTKGMHDAFGGLFARFEKPIHPDGSTSYDKSAEENEGEPTQRGAHVTSGQSGSLAQRVGIKVRSDIKAGERRDDPDAGDGDDNN
jgi:hypothetical protein